MPLLAALPLYRCRPSSCTSRADRLWGLIAIADAPRATARDTVRDLKGRGVKVAMLTGDNRETAERIAGELGIDIVLAEVLPGQKADEVKKLQAQGNKVGKSAGTG